MYSSPSLKNKKLDTFDISRNMKSNPLYAMISLKKKKNLLKSFLCKKEEFQISEKKNKYNTCNINKIKDLSIQSDLFQSKKKIKTMKYLIKYNSESNIMQNSIKKENNKITNNNNYLLLTSLYKLPVIKNKNKSTKKSQSPIFFNSGINNNYISPDNTSSFNSKKSFNDSITSIYNESFNNYINFRYINEINNNNMEFNQSNQSHQSHQGNQNKNKKNIFSNLYSTLKDKYYIDVEKRYNHKLDARLFPSDHSMKDKIIHMKKVSIFWNSVFKYCVPIINGRKYKLQHMLSEQKKIKDLNLNQSHSNYYDIFVKENKNNAIRFNKSQSLSKII